MTTRPDPWHRLATLARGGLVGALATFVDIVALVVLVHLGVPPAAASGPALAAGVAVQFFGSKVFTFADPSPAWLRQGALFLVVEVAAFALNLALFERALHLGALAHAPLAAVRLVTTSLVYVAFSLPLWSLIFRGRAP